jgi:hypothetical protein
MRFLPKRGRRPADAEAEPVSRHAPARDLRADLARRGISGSFSEPVASRLATRVDGLTEAQYRALLEGVTAAYGVHRDEGRAPQPAPAEMQRLIQDFAVELQKLDEGLRLLSTYLLRIRDRTAGEPPRLVH